MVEFDSNEETFRPKTSAPSKAILSMLHDLFGRMPLLRRIFSEPSANRAKVHNSLTASPDGDKETLVLVKNCCAIIRIYGDPFTTKLRFTINVGVIHDVTDG